MVVKLYTDGAARGNPGEAAIAFIITDGGKELQRHNERIGIATNNVAEYTALIKGLEAAAKYAKEIEVLSDSQLVIRQMRGLYRVKEKHLRELFRKAKEMESLFANVSYRSVSRSDSVISRVDKLANEALDGI